MVERFDRELSQAPAKRLHQEDLCQALGLTPDFKYQRAGWQRPSYEALAELLDRHSPAPGLDRLAAARAGVFHFLVGNADAHAKNVSLLHVDGGARLAPLYDVVSTAAYPDLNTELSLAVGDELHPEAVATAEWMDFSVDLGLSPRSFERERLRLAESVMANARELRDEARAEGWHDEIIEVILSTIAARVEQVRANSG